MQNIYHLNHPGINTVGSTASDKDDLRSGNSYKGKSMAGSIGHNSEKLVYAQIECAFGNLNV